MDDRGSMAIMVVVGVFVLAAAVAFCVYLVSGEVEGALRRIVHRVIKRLPFQSIKIVVVVWQILTQVRGPIGNYLVPNIMQYNNSVRVLDSLSPFQRHRRVIAYTRCETYFHWEVVKGNCGTTVVKQSFTLCAIARISLCRDGS